MFKEEERCIPVLSTLLVGIFIFVFDIIAPIFLYLFTIPLYMIAIMYITRVFDSKEKMGLAVTNCLEESDFNVIDKVEQLRVYFSDTTDVISYLSMVDSRILTYVFDENNFDLTYKNFVIGAVNCLNIFKGFRGACYFTIDITSIPDSERITTLLSTLYMVSEQINKGSSSIYIRSRQTGSHIIIDAENKYRDNMVKDPFCEKLLTIFSSKQYTFSHGVVSSRLKAKCI